MAIAVGSSVTTTPGVPSFGNLKKQVAQYVQGMNDPELLEMAGDGINDAIHFFNSRKWLWTLTSQDITTVASTATYSINAALKKPRKCALLNSSSQQIKWLDWVDPKSFLDENWDRSTAGDPTHYTIKSSIKDGTIELNVPPSAGWVSNYPTIRLHYFARVNTLDSDGSSPVVPPEFVPLLLWYARWYVGVNRGLDSREIDRAFAHWNRIWRDLIADDNNVLTDWEV